MHFIYVMNRTDKARLEDLGYEFMKEDTVNKIWVFKNKEVDTFAQEDALTESGINFILSDMLTF